MHWTEQRGLWLLSCSTPGTAPNLQPQREAQHAALESKFLLAIPTRHLHKGQCERNMHTGMFWCIKALEVVGAYVKPKLHQLWNLNKAMYLVCNICGRTGCNIIQTAWYELMTLLLFTLKWLKSSNSYPCNSCRFQDEQWITIIAIDYVCWNGP